MKSKDKRNVILVIGAIILLGFFGGIFSIGYDDFITVEDFQVLSPELTHTACVPISSAISGVLGMSMCKGETWELYSGARGCGGGSSMNYESSFNVVNNKLMLASAGYPVSATYLKNIDNQDFKTKITLSVNNPREGALGSGIFNIKMGSNVIYENTISTYGYVTKDYLVELIRDINEPLKIHVFINGEETKSFTQIIGDKIFFEVADSTYFCGIGGSATMAINPLKTRAYFNCNVGEDQIVIKDTFKEGSTVDIHALTYSVSNFCPDNYPAIRRSLVEQGSRADIQGIITKQIAQGQSIAVPSGQLLEVYYITGYHSDMGQRCGLGEAYSTLTHSCSGVIEEAKNTVTFVNEKETIVVGRNQVSFINGLKIADKTFSSETPLYLCASENAKANMPYPRAECWQDKIFFDNQNTLLNYGVNTPLDNYLNIQFNGDAKFENGAVSSSTNRFLLTLNNNNILTTSTVDLATSEYYTMFKTDKQICLSVKNNYGDFDQEHSGIQVTSLSKIQIAQNSYRVPLALKIGDNKYCIKGITDTYGQFQYTLQPYFIIGDQTFYDDVRVNQNYEVVDKIPTDITIINKETTITLSFWEYLMQLWDSLLITIGLK